MSNAIACTLLSIMRAIVSCLILLLATVECRSDVAADAKEILRLENAIKDAFLKHDKATIGSIIADDFQSWSSKGERRGKADVLRAVEKSEDDDTKIEDPDVRVYGDAAVFTARIIETGKHADGLAFSTKSFITVFWIRRGGKWQVVDFVALD